MTTYLPLLTDADGIRHGSRSLMTCHYKCGNACDQPVPNTSENPHFSEVVTRVLSRRAVLAGGAAGTGALALSGLVTAPAAAAPRRRRSPQLGTTAFRPVPPNRRDDVVVPPGFTSEVIIRWGDPVTAGAPAFDAYDQTAEKAQQQFGYNNDYVGVLPLRGGNYLVAVNHEYTNEELMFPDGEYTDDEKRRIAMASHGMSVITIKKTGDGGYRMSGQRRFNRRLHTGSEFELVGPAAGDDRLKTSDDPSGRIVLGTLNNCAGGLTPWGTALSGEENFNQYFSASGGSLPPQNEPGLKRLGFSTTSSRNWAAVDDRFDMTKEPNEPHRFGWIVEIDPYDPDSTPRKHTMLGRFKHEGANVTIAKNGKVVAYMGDDERGDYVYRFVSRGTYDPRRTRKARRANMELLTRGTLYVGRFTDEGGDRGIEYDGVLEWIPLCSDTRSFVDGMSVVDVLIDTRLAADKVGPTRMDRPEDVEVNPVNGRVYAALTNNANRGVAYPTDEANPIGSSQVRNPAPGAPYSNPSDPLTNAAGNRNGYVLEMWPRNGDHTSDRFFWQLMLVCGDPSSPETYFAGYPSDKVSPISCPDNVAFDKQGNLWVATDGNQIGSNDGLFRVPVKGRERGHVEQLLTVPLGAETCGPFISDDQRTVFIAVQHPGEADGSSFDSPLSTWPHTDDFPRPSIVAAHRA